MKKEEITRQVRARYADVVRQNGSCCCSGTYAKARLYLAVGLPAPPVPGILVKTSATARQI
jgi:hypothetical protein